MVKIDPEVFPLAVRQESDMTWLEVFVRPKSPDNLVAVCGVTYVIPTVAHESNE
jgi:hypothetical protein